MTRRIVLATGNAGKLREMRAILAGHDLEVVAQSEFGIVPPIEDGDSFAANALIKARHAAAIAGLPGHRRRFRARGGRARRPAGPAHGALCGTAGG